MKIIVDQTDLPLGGIGRFVWETPSVVDMIISASKEVIPQNAVLEHAGITSDQVEKLLVGEVEGLVQSFLHTIVSALLLKFNGEDQLLNQTLLALNRLQDEGKQGRRRMQK